MSIMQIFSRNSEDFEKEVNAEFDRVSRLMSTGSNQYRGFVAGEIDALAALLEEKRAESLAGASFSQSIHNWLLAGGAQRVLTADPRARAIYEARNERRRAASTGPIRYFGFRDDGEFRIFNFGRLPMTDDAAMLHVSVSLTFFTRQSMSLQDGPGFCATILSEKEDPADYEVTAEDVEKFLASRRVKSGGKGAARAVIA